MVPLTKRSARWLRRHGERHVQAITRDFYSLAWPFRPRSRRFQLLSTTPTVVYVCRDYLPLIRATISCAQSSSPHVLFLIAPLICPLVSPPCPVPSYMFPTQETGQTTDCRPRSSCLMKGARKRKRKEKVTCP